MRIDYDISDIRPFINWIYFDYAWSMNGKDNEERDRLHADANAMLDRWQGSYHTHAVFRIVDANSDGDDIIADGVRLPMLRQQKPTEPGRPNLCLADFIRPASKGIKDRIGVFAATVDHDMTRGYDNDDYGKMLSQVLADRLAEGTAELTHLQVRRKYWGYAPNENLSIKELHAERYQGIRPAVGYPSMPDTSMNFLIDKLINMGSIGIRLTESGMMQPHASTSGLMFAHPQARYFELGKIGEDQLIDYARRRPLPVGTIRRFLQSSLLKQ